MRIEQARRVVFSTPQGPLGRLLGLVVLFFVVVLAVVFFAVGAVVVGMGLLLAPVIGWWRSRKLRGSGGASIERPAAPEAIGEEPPPAIIDAEFTPVPDRPADQTPTE